jgi:hypothetical protein
VSEVLGYEAIGAQSAPRLVAAAALIEIDGKPHVLDERTGAIHRVHPRTALAASFFTGDVTLEVLAEDFAAVFDVPPPSLTEDLVGIARHLGHIGVLEGVTNVSTMQLGGPEDTGTTRSHVRSDPFDAPDYLHVAPNA